jgi:hypothetical protein
MAVLDGENRRRAWAQAMRNWPAGIEIPPVTKQDLRAAVDAYDDAIESLQSTINQALPQPFRGAASTQAKTYLFCLVAMRRAGLLRALED